MDKENVEQPEVKEVINDTPKYPFDHYKFLRLKAIELIKKTIEFLFAAKTLIGKFEF